LCYRILGDVISKTRPDEARDWYQKALQRIGPLAQQNSKVVNFSIEWAGVYLNLSDLERKTEDLAAAQAALERARDILKPLAEQSTPVARCQRDLAVTLRQLSKIQTANSEMKAAAQSLMEASR